MNEETKYKNLKKNKLYVYTKINYSNSLYYIIIIFYRVQQTKNHQRLRSSVTFDVQLWTP